MQLQASHASLVVLLITAFTANGFTVQNTKFDLSIQAIPPPQEVPGQPPRNNNQRLNNRQNRETGGTPPTPPLPPPSPQRNQGRDLVERQNGGPGGNNRGGNQGNTPRPPPPPPGDGGQQNSANQAGVSLATFHFVDQNWQSIGWRAEYRRRGKLGIGTSDLSWLPLGCCETWGWKQMAGQVYSIFRAEYLTLVSW